jgi:1-phosphofructokinase/tagatose 6-phosphate kinase
MFLTITMNTALDKTLSVPSFMIGGRHRASSSVTQPGGKGINVARALRLLGHPVIASGLAGGRTGLRIIEELTFEGILNDFVRIADEARMSIAVVDPTGGAEVTEINEYGPVVSEAELALFVEKARYLVKGASWVVLAGSLPRRVDEGFYATLCRELRRGSVKGIVLDTDGEPMRQAIRAEPAIVFPNAREAEELVGHEFTDQADLVAGVAELCALGAQEAVITFDFGAVARLTVGRGQSATYVGTGFALEPVSTVGSGDAFLAAFLAARDHGASPEDALRRGLGCAAANTQMFGAGRFDPAAAAVYADRVTVEQVDG